MLIAITRATNGLILRKVADPEEGEILSVIEDTASGDINVKALMYEIMEVLGEYGSKHSDTRIRVVSVLQRAADSNEEYTIEKDGYTYVRITEDSHV